MQKITPFLWFDDQAEEAINFYLSVFKNSKIINESRQGGEGPGKPGKLFTATFQLEGQQFMALNAGPMYKFTPAISLFVDCVNQAEVDQLWSRLLEGGGEESRCGWLTDRFGLSWQIIPQAMSRYLGDPDPVRAGRAMQAMMQMVKIDVAALEKAWQG